MTLRDVLRTASDAVADAVFEISLVFEEESESMILAREIEADLTEL